MSHESGIRLRWTTLIVVAAALLGVGAGAAYLLLRQNNSPAHSAVPGNTATPSESLASSPGTPDTAPGAALPDVVVPLSPEAASRAGIETTVVVSSSGAGQIRIPGVVQPNAYRSVMVTPIVAGRVTRVAAELGQRVTRGQVIADVYSPDLAEAQTRFLSSRAELGAHEQVLRRTEKLVDIGAASRQELEKIHAEHATATTMVESNRARLLLLGMTASDIEALSASSPLQSTVHIVAPIDGVITDRQANVGLNVEPSNGLFTVVDLSTVWIVGELYERDFASVRVGSAVAITTTAYPDLKLEGTISYIDPSVKSETRTAQVRVEVPNPNGVLRLGMYADILVATPRTISGVAIPRSAVQAVGDRSVVYLVDPQDRAQFVEREVRLGEPNGDQILVLGGLKAGDVVVSSGSFSVRAERERLGLRPTNIQTDAGTSAGPQTARVVLSEQGYEPSRVSLRAGVPARLTFVRATDQTCGTEITVPSLNIRRALPLNEPVTIDLTPQKSGEIAFECGMKMLKGVIVVQ